MPDAKIRIDNEPGWKGAFTRHQAEGALQNGTRVVKIKTETGDARPIGARGTVLGSLPTYPEQGLTQQAYFVEWDNFPRFAVGILGWKIAPLEEP